MNSYGFFGKIAILWGFLFCHFNSTYSMYADTRPRFPSEVKSLKKVEQQKLEQKLEAQAQQRKKKCYDLAMILDPNIEKSDGKTSASVETLREFFDKASFPIIVSSNIVENYSLWKKGLGQYPERWANFPEWAMKFYPTDKDWYCFAHKTAPLILFVPKKYIAQFSPQHESTPLEEQMKQCGFAISSPDADTSNIHIFEDLLPDTLLKHIERQGLTSVKDYNIKASDIESFFVKPTQFTIPYVSSWNIYLTGHGGYVSAQLKALIAGLYEDQFFNLMKMFENIKTSFLFYTACYTSGQNLIKVQKELAKLTVNFMVGTQGVNEAFSASSFFNPEFFSNLEVFFNDPKAFLLKTKNAGWKKGPIGFLLNYAISKDVSLDVSQPWIYIPSAGVFDAVSVDKSVKILTQSLAKAHELEGKTIDFTDPDIKTIIIYPSYIGIPVKIKAHVAILSPTGLRTEMDPIQFEIKQGEKEEGPKELVAKESGSKVLHVFEKITYEDKLSSIIPNFVSFQSSFFPILFVIKELVCLDYNESGLGAGDNKWITLKNVIIYKIRNVRSNVLHDRIVVSFDYNGNVYGFDQTIEDLAENSKKLFEQFAHLKVKEGNAFADKSSLEDMVKKTESYIDKEMFVQKPGALKKVLLKQYAQQQSNLPWSMRIKFFFKTASKTFSDMLKNARNYIKKKIFLKEEQKTPKKLYGEKQR